MDFSKSETKKNLLRAFAGESQARNRYTFGGSLARKENLYVVEAVFKNQRNTAVPETVPLFVCPRHIRSGCH